MKGFQARALWFSHQWPRKTRQKKIAKSVVGKSIATRMLRQASDAGGKGPEASGALQRSQTPHQEATLRVVRGQIERPPVRGGRILGSSRPTEQIGLGRMERLVAHERL